MFATDRKGEFALAGETESLVSASCLLPVEFGASTDQGQVRTHNEDSLVAAPPIFAVADGMGGHESGEYASGETIQVFLELRQKEWITEADVLSAFDEAQEKVRSITAHSPRSAGTTVSGVALAIVDDVPNWLVFNLGDSRTYRYADDQLEQLTRDHSEVQELVDSGQISPEEARHYPRRNVLTRAVGIGKVARPDLRLVPVRPRDTIMICSDGLTNELDDEHIAQIIAEGHDPQVTADALVDGALSAGGKDNVSVVVIKVAGPTGSGLGDAGIAEGKTADPAERHQNE